MKAQLRRANRQGARYAVVLGEQELEQGQVQLKPLSGDAEIETVGLDDLIQRVTERFVVRDDRVKP